MYLDSLQKGSDFHSGEATNHSPAGLALFWGRLADVALLRGS